MDAVKRDQRRRARVREWHKANRDKVLLYRRRYRLKTEYGITEDDYQRMLASQQGACAVCLKPFSGSPHVDHCHATGRVRGLLCHLCNTALGKLNDDPERLRRAAAYVEGV